MDSEFLKKKPQQSRSRAVVSALVSALEQLIDRSEDLSGISVQRVAERAGVGIGSLYDYFSNREGLFGQFLVQLTDENFNRLQAALDSTRGQPLSVAVDRMVDETLATYLTVPKRTQAAISTIARLGWFTPVIRERDRFAQILTDRILVDLPHLPRERVDASTRLVCDAAMGVMMAELWRPTPDAAAGLRDLAHSLLSHQLGVKI